MRKHSQALIAAAVAAALSLSAVSSLLVAGAKPAPPPLTLKVGDTAPDFSLKYFNGEKLSDVSLKDYRGKKSVLLAFYVFAFTGG